MEQKYWFWSPHNITRPRLRCNVIRKHLLNREKTFSKPQSRETWRKWKFYRNYVEKCFLWSTKTFLQESHFKPVSLLYCRSSGATGMNFPIQLYHSWALVFEESGKKVNFALKYGFATLIFELRFSIQVDNMFLINISFLLLRKCFSLVLYL